MSKEKESKCPYCGEETKNNTFCSEMCYKEYYENLRPIWSSAR